MQEAILRNLLTRRSIRKYLPKPVPRELLEKIVEAALYAPSAMGRQPWHFVVLAGEKRIADLTVALKEAVARMPENIYQKFVGNPEYTVSYHAPALIMVSADPAKPNAEADCALALGNIFLAAHALDLGTCWINQMGSACPDERFRALLTELGVPPQNYIYGCAAVGWPDGPRPEAAPRKSGKVNYVLE
ncbi:MAG: nitroreductase [Desulfovibrionaceae bacterium]|nr:nitroreductase [Desulfovibrionaceae bacterium]